MAMVINSNIMSLNAQRNLTMSQGDQNQAMERLTSGKRINSAADDAAGLAISNRMTSQVRGLDQAIRNANDGISLIQTAEGALDETTNILQRMRELSIQSANGTYDEGNRATLDAEVQQLISEIDRISETTKFNGLQILDGTLGDVELQAGADANETISLNIGATNSNSLGGNAGDVVGESVTNGIADLDLFTATDAAHTLYVNDVALSDLSTGTTLNDALNIANTDLAGKGAEVSTLATVTAANVGDGQLIAGTNELVLTVVDGDTETSTYTITDTNSLDELVEKINTTTTVEASVDSDGKLVLTAEGVTSLQVDDNSTSQGATGIADVTQNFSLVFTDTTSDKSGVKIEVGAANETDVATLGINVHDDDGNLVGTTVTNTTASTLQDGDLIINGVDIASFSGDTNAVGTVDNTIEAINKLSDVHGVVAFETAGDTDQISLRSTSGGEISVEYGENATDATVLALTGLAERNTGASASSVANIDISTAAGAQKAIGTIDAALEQINSTRGDLGAVNNRLDFTVNNLSNVSENVAAARSRIEDADFAAESAALSRAQVLQQAGTAMLAQANAAPQQVLSLLQ